MADHEFYGQIPQDDIPGAAPLIHTHAGSDLTSVVPTSRLPGASTSGYGILMLAGDLAGTAAAPTVPGRLPNGGTTGQVLTKTGSADFADAWADPPGRVVARAARTTSPTASTATAAASATKTLELATITLRAGRRYRIAVEDVGVFTQNGAGTNGSVALQLTYTTAAVGGTPATPAANSTRLKFTQNPCATGAVISRGSIVAHHTPASDQTIRFLLSHYMGGAVAGTASVYGAADWPIEMVVTDLGADPGSTAV